MAPNDSDTQSPGPAQPPAPTTQPIAGITLASGGNEAASPPEMHGIYELRELRDLGPNLPVGFPTGDQRVRLFRLRPFRLKDEKAVGALREKGKGLTMGAFVNGVLSLMVQTCGPHSFDAMKEQQRKLSITMLPMADVLYMYLYLRYDALGDAEPVTMSLKCPSCSSPFMFKADLGSLLVRVVPDSVNSLRRPYVLRDGVSIQGRMVNTLFMEPLKWNAFERPEFNVRNLAEREAATVRHSIVGAEGFDPAVPFVFTESDMDELTKYDLEGIISDIEYHSPGPQMTVQADCSVCRHEFRTMLEWSSYDSFFSRSSQRSHSKS